jgi:8-oxo-dGTP pyrophosphatase MutT (NUDIX family)
MKNSFGIVPVYLDKKGKPEFLLLRAYNYWDFPKGKSEKGEEPLDVAKRELQEETGITKIEFTWGEDFFETEPYNTPKKVARYYLAQVFSKDVSISHEHHEFKWLTKKDAEKLLVPRVAQVLNWALQQML